MILLGHPLYFVLPPQRGGMGVILTAESVGEDHAKAAYRYSDLQ